MKYITEDYLFKIGCCRPGIDRYFKEKNRKRYRLDDLFSQALKDAKSILDLWHQVRHPIYYALYYISHEFSAEQYLKYLNWMNKSWEARDARDFELLQELCQEGIDLYIEFTEKPSRKSL